MAARGVRGVYKGIIDILVVLANPVSKSRLLNHFFVAHLISLNPRPRLDVCELCTYGWLLLGMDNVPIHSMLVRAKLLLLVLLLVVRLEVLLVWLGAVRLLLNHLSHSLVGLLLGVLVVQGSCIIGLLLLALGGILTLGGYLLVSSFLGVAVLLRS